MSKNLEKKFNEIRKLVDNYHTLEDVDKIDAANNIKTHLNKCKKVITDYLKIISNIDDYLSESPNSPESDESDKDLFKYNLDQINKIKILMDKPGITIDEKISLYIDLIKYTNFAKEYLDKKKELLVEYI